MEDKREISFEISKRLYDEIKESDIDIAAVAVSALQKALYLKKQENDLRKGYYEMAEINLGLAEMNIEAGNEALEITEHYLLNDLTESE